MIALVAQTLLHSSDKIGDILQVVIPLSAYATTLYLDDEEGESQFYKSFATTVGVTYLLKYSVDKERPNGDSHSFPSGHASLSFQGATFIHKRYGFLYSLPAYIGATYAAYSRVEVDEHYVEDVVAGAVIGSLSSFYFTTTYKGFEIQPLVADSRYGVILRKSW